MNPLKVIRAKRAHLERLSNQTGAEGENLVVAQMDSWIERPKGRKLRTLLEALASEGIEIKVQLRYDRTP